MPLIIYSDWGGVLSSYKTTKEVNWLIWLVLERGQTNASSVSSIAKRMSDSSSNHHTPDQAIGHTLLRVGEGGCGRFPSTSAAPFLKPRKWPFNTFRQKR